MMQMNVAFLLFVYVCFVCLYFDFSHSFKGIICKASRMVV